MAGMGWGGIIAGALAAGGAGAMSSVAKDIDEEQKAAMQAKRDEALARIARETHKVNLQTSVESQIENAPRLAQAASDAADLVAPAANEREARKYETMTPLEVDRASQLEETKNKQRILPAGSRLVDADGNVIVEAAEKTLTAEEKELIRARIDESKAGAEEKRSRADKNERGPTEKAPTKSELPNFVPAPEIGRGWEKDINAGVYRRIIKGTPEEPASKVMGFEVSGAKPAVPPSVQYLDKNLNTMTAEDYYKRYPKSAGAKADAAEEPAPAAKGRSASGKISEAPKGPKRTIVARGTDKKTGQRVVKYSDGSIEPE